MSVQMLARDFDAAVLRQLADAAQHRAQLIVELEAKPWRRSAEQNDAIHTFKQFAWYARRILEMQQDR